MDDIFSNLISLKEGAELVKKDESTIRKHILNGKFKIGYDCKKFGKQWIFRIEALKRFYFNNEKGYKYMTYNTNIDNIINIIKCDENKEGFELLFNLIDRSLINNGFNSKQQDLKFKELLKKEELSDIMNMKNAIYILKKELYQLIKKEEFDNELESIGIHGEDSFNDFAVWIIAQGKEFVNKVFVYGIDYTLDYIKENNVSIEDYGYEGLLIYCFIEYDN